MFSITKFKYLPKVVLEHFEMLFARIDELEQYIEATEKCLIAERIIVRDLKKQMEKI